MMKTDNELIRYWHPVKGGWYHARLVRRGRKWASVRDLSPRAKRHRIRLSDIDVLPDSHATDRVKALAAKADRLTEEYQSALEAELQPICDQLQKRDYEQEPEGAGRVPCRAMTGGKPGPR